MIVWHGSEARIDPDAWEFLTQRWAGLEARERSLLLWGSWSDGRYQPCECCGKSIVVLESTRSPADITNTWRRWVEVMSGEIEDGVQNIVVTVHDQQRCQQLRQEEVRR